MAENPQSSIDALIAALEKRWAEMNVSAQHYTAMLRRTDRPAVHFNTLLKLGRPNWSPSRQVLRDLERALIIDPVPAELLKPKAPRRPRAPRHGVDATAAAAAAAPHPTS